MSLVLFILCLLWSLVGARNRKMLSWYAAGEEGCKVEPNIANLGLGGWKEEGEGREDMWTEQQDALTATHHTHTRQTTGENMRPRDQT